MRGKNTSVILNDAWVINLRRKKMNWKLLLDICYWIGSSFAILFTIAVICYTLDNIFKKMFKSKNKIKRFPDNNWFPKIEMTEQKYVDEKFKTINERLERLEEEIKIFEHLNEKEHIFISTSWGLIFRDKDIDLRAEEGRVWAKENGYYYVNTFNHRGELWIKEDKK